MPDITEVLLNRWKMIASLTMVATLLALVICLLQPKEFLSTVTALPANSALADKARVFNNSIEALYPEIGTTDELDRIEGTAKLDTIYLFVAQKYNLVRHYEINADSEGLYKAAVRLKKATDIRRSAYGELKINVWDKSPAMAAHLANAILDKLNNVHQAIQSSNNTKVLTQLRAAYAQKQQAFDSFQRVMSNYNGNSTLPSGLSPILQDSVNATRHNSILSSPLSLSMVQEQIKEYHKIISQYELATGTSISPLIVVENARPSLYADRQKIFQTLLFVFGASLLFSILLAVVTENSYRKQ